MEQPNQTERLWAIVCHLSGFLIYLIPWFGSILGPLVVWNLKRNSSPFIYDQGKEALNFGVCIMVYFGLAYLVFIAHVGIGTAIMYAVAIFQFILTILAAVRVYNGIAFRYPYTVRFLKN
jgi:hypothetical protein